MPTCSEVKNRINILNANQFAVATIDSRFGLSEEFDEVTLFLKTDFVD